MSIAERYREYARVIDMCEGTGVDPRSCVRYEPGTAPIIEPHGVDLYRQGNYDFAVAILEGKPLFIGDDVYLIDGRKYDWETTWMEQTINHLTWNKPRKTFTLAGHEVPIPTYDTSLKPCKQVGDMKYYFDSGEDANSFSLSIQAIIHEAIENARLQNK